MNRKPKYKLISDSTASKIDVFAHIFVAVFLISALSACNLLKQATGPANQTNPGQTRPADMNPGQAQATSNLQKADTGNLGPVSGYWQMGYILNDQTYTSHIRITEKNYHFTGEGTDDHNNKTFKVEQGTISDGKVVFYKRYDNPSNKEQTPVEYDGNLDLSGVPYMSGTFIVALNGRELTGQWEAEMQKTLDGKPVSGGQSQPAQKTPQEKPQAQQQTQHFAKPDHAPDLSGKWNTGFEYRFKDIHSTMWLEQHGDKLKGHGIDHNTNEKFTINKGWYAFPKVTLIREYPQIKGKKGVIPAHKMIFKALVEWIDTPEYQGPYMKGKTDGGGNWEAQIVR